MSVIDDKANAVCGIMEKRYKVDHKVCFDPLTIIAVIGLLITIGKTIYDCWKQKHPSTTKEPDITFAKFAKLTATTGILKRIQLQLLVAKELHRGTLNPYIAHITFGILDAGQSSTEEEFEQYAAHILQQVGSSVS